LKKLLFFRYKIAQKKLPPVIISLGEVVMTKVILNEVPQTI
jgi:hypothetical protein